ncbi:glycosyltransferase family 4 protein, partial [Oligoflexia bacterium]|nr:glycosyltransferase family 4 protein [Oligoflexia bacterium]
SATRGLIYHNLTPAHWFKGVNPRIVADIEAGVAELPDLLAKTDRVIADSKFNAGELKQLGFEATVLELPVDPTRWSVEANSGISNLIKSDPGIHVVHVGRLAPNKCVEDIIKSFYFLHHHVNDQSKLWLVGIDIDTELYSFALKRLVHELKLDHAVNFVGCLADAEVKALYSAATVYLCMSEHEGFCLPVLEAMHFGLPVVAYASSALSDTVGAGGIMISEKKHPEIAELINHIYEDQAFRQKLIKAGRDRVKELSFERFARSVGAIFSASDHKTLLSAGV